MCDIKLNYDTARFRLCFDSKSSGRLVSQRLREPILFTDVAKLLLIADVVMDAQEYPRASQAKRSFFEPTTFYVNLPYAKKDSEMMDADIVNSSFGETATLLLQVVSRHNVSWQGTLSFAEEGEDFFFDSEMQLLKHLDKLI